MIIYSLSGLFFSGVWYSYGTLSVQMRVFMPKTVSKPKNKAKCRLCGALDHTARNHEKAILAAAEPEKKHTLPEIPSTLPALNMKLIVEQKLVGQEGEVLHVCSYPLCKNTYDVTGYGNYCSQTCMMFDAKRRSNLKGKKGDTYKPEYAGELLRNYLLECEVSHQPRMVKIGDSLIPLKRTMLPGVEGYALFIGKSVYTLLIWAKKYTDFREAMLMLKSVQKMYLQNNGLVGTYGASLATFLLMNNHGMREKSERTVNNTFGIVREVYEKADSYEQMNQFDKPFEELGSRADSEGDDEPTIV